MAEALFPDDPKRAETLVAKVPLGHAEADRADALRTLCRLLQLTDAADASEGWAAYLDGIHALRLGNYEQAVKTWIEMIAYRQRGIDDDGARRAVIAIFHWLGADHPVTRGHQRAFSSALF